jgi:chaperonin GroES
LQHQPAPDTCPDAQAVSAAGVAATSVSRRRKAMAIKFTPLHDRVLVKRMEESNKTASGLYIPDSAKEKPLEGEVLAVGGGKLNSNGTISPMNVKVGDKIVFGKFTGYDVKIDGEDLLIVREDEIFGIVK